MIVKPPFPHWSVANQYGTLSGNTTGSSTFSGTNVVFAGGTGITLQASSDTVYIHGATTVPASAFSFANSNGVSWGTSGSTVTATVKTDYLTTAALSDHTHSQYLTTAQPPGAYLTTAAQSDHSHGSVAFGLTNVSATASSASSGLSLSLSVAAPGGGAAVNVSAGTTSGNLQTIQFADSNGVSFGLNGSTLTASHNGYTGATTQFLTTTPTLDEVRDPAADKVFAMGVRHLQFQYAGGGSFSTNATRQGLFEIDAAGNYTDGADVVHIHQSVGNPTIDLLHLEAEGTGVHPLHIVAAGDVAGELNKPWSYETGGSVPMVMGTGYSNSVANLNAHYLQGRLSSAMAGTAGAITGGSITVNTAGVSVALPAYLTTAALSQDSSKYAGTAGEITGGSITVNTAGVSVNLPAYLTTAQPPGAYLTTARASNDAVGLNTAGTSVTWTVNSSGISLNAGAYLTTAANSTHSHGDPTLALTNLTGTTASASNGFTLSLSAAAPGGGAGATVSEYEPIQLVSGLTNSSLGHNSLYFYPFDLPVAVSAYRLNLFVSIGTTVSATNLTGSGGHTLSAALYTRAATATDRIASIWSCSAAWRLTQSSNTQVAATNVVGIANSTAVSTVAAGISNANASTYPRDSMAGFRIVAFPVSSTLTPGRYWFAIANSVTSANGTCAIRLSVLQQTQGGVLAYTPLGTSSSASNVSRYQILPGIGTYSATSGAFPATVALTTADIRAANPTNLMPYFNLSAYTTGAAIP